MDVAREAPEVQEMLSGKEEMQIGSRQSPQTRACGRNTHICSASYIFREKILEPTTDRSR